jgi:hypothetical protein
VVVRLDAFADLFDAGGVVEVGLAGSSHGDSPKHLGAHDRTEARSAVGVLQLVQHAGVTDHFLACGADLGDPDLLVAQLVPDHRLGLAGALAPDRRGVLDCDVAVVDPEVDRLAGFAGDQDGVEACQLKLGSPPPAGLGLSEGAGEG